MSVPSTTMFEVGIERGDAITRYEGSTTNQSSPEGPTQPPPPGIDLVCAAMIALGMVVVKRDI
jgi:hypothetical protein